MTEKKMPPARVKARKGQSIQSKPADGGNVTINANIAPDGPYTEHVNPAPPISSAMLKTGTDAALDFMQRWAPEGPWALTAIRPDKKQVHGRLFTKEQFSEMGKWIKEHNGKFNMYFSVNTVMREFKQKASRADIKSLDWLHVDIDARPANPDLTADAIAAHLKAEFARIYEKLTNNLPSGVPEPSVITFSGGGYQAFWKLAEPVPIDGDDAKYEDAKLYNVQLEILFGGDNCHNVDRIMRLPGTLNIPDAKKLKKGRKPALSVVKKFAADIAYPIADFAKAVPVQLPNGQSLGGGNATDSIKVSGNVERLADVGELDKWEVPERVKVIIVQGHHPEETKEDNSRSSWLFDVICNLYRKEVPEDVIYSVITDREFGISASVLDKGSNIDKYALRQMARAKEEAIDPWLRKLNELHFVVGNEGGKCRVMEEVIDPVLKRPRLTRQSFQDFRNRYLNKPVIIGYDDDGKPEWGPVGHWWLSHKQRIDFATIVFAPEQEIPNAYNLWRGYAFDSIPGTKHESFLRHLHDNLCRGNEGYYRYLLGWIARAVQRPGEQGHVAVVLRGGKGVGKGVFAKHFGKLFGRHFLHISNAAHLTGHFNAHQRDCIILFADEAFYAGDRKHDSVLKTIITEDMLAIEGKGQDIVQSPNFIHLIMSTNEDYAVRASEDERRYFVLDVGKDKQQDTAYFAAIDADLVEGGYQNLLHFLKTYDLADFDVRAVPKTSALHDQQQHTRPAWQHAIIRMAEFGVAPDHDGWKPDGAGWVSSSGILESAGEDFEETSLLMSAKKGMEPLLAKELDMAGRLDFVGRNVSRECFCEEGRIPIPVHNVPDSMEHKVRRRQRRMFKLRPLLEVRAELEKMGLHGEWDASTTEWKPRDDRGWQTAGEGPPAGAASSKPPF